MMNGGALYTDGSGNLPELNSLANFVADLTGRLQGNRESIAKINVVADRVIEQEREKIRRLQESCKKHDIYVEDEGNEGGQPDEEDDPALLTAGSNQFITEERAPRVLGKKKGLLNSKISASTDDRQSKEIQRRRQSLAALNLEDDEDEGVEVEEDEPEEESVADTQSTISRENLNLRIELQRLEVLETRMSELVKRFEMTAVNVRDGSQNYMREYSAASQSLVDSYESRLQLEKEAQERLLEIRSRMMDELASLNGIIGQTSLIMGNDIRQKLEDGPGNLIKYSTRTAL